jgi:hypothetical protein
LGKWWEIWLTPSYLAPRRAEMCDLNSFATLLFAVNI